MTNVMSAVFQDLEEAHIRYLHFKSNTNLDNSFDGRGDFDVLIDPKRIEEAEQIIAQNNGKRFNPSRIGRYPGVDNWMIFDKGSGRLYHLHLHYQLATGKALVKDYVIPWRELLFDTRIKDERYGLYVADPNMEMLLLIVRTILKSTVKQRFIAAIGRFRMFPSMEKEFKDLTDKVSIGTFIDYAHKCGFEDEAIDCLVSAVKEPKIDSGNFNKISKIVRDKMQIDRRMNGSCAALLSAYYSARRKAMSVYKNHTNGTAQIKKVHDTNGLIVAFVGVDGAGKSTVTKEIYKWLNKKIECKRFYMGSGDGRVPLSMRLLNLFKSRNKHTSADDKQAKGAVKIQTLSRFKQPIKYIRRMMKLRAYYAVEKSNRKKMIAMQRYRLNGGISLLDRYPQIEFSGMNDGPKIVEFKETFAESDGIDRLIQKEMDAMGIVKNVKPDIIFRLNISAETSMKRKPEQKNIDLFRKKIEDLNKITFQNAKIIDVDAEQPYESELLEIKSILWSLM